MLLRSTKAICSSQMRIIVFASWKVVKKGIKLMILRISGRKHWNVLVGWSRILYSSKFANLTFRWNYQIWAIKFLMNAIQDIIRAHKVREGSWFFIISRNEHYCFKMSLPFPFQFLWIVWSSWKYNILIHMNIIIVMKF